MIQPLDRYLLKEISPPFLLSLLIVTFLLASNEMLLLFERFISSGISFMMIMLLFFLLVPSILSLTIPMALLVGILSGLSRMATDQEIIALETLGINRKKIFRPILCFSFLGFLITVLLQFYLAPWANQKWASAFTSFAYGTMQNHLKPGVFNTTLPESIIYFQKATPRNGWKNVFIQTSSDEGEMETIFAQNGMLHVYPGQMRAVIELHNGIIHSYQSSAPEKYGILAFEKMEEEIKTDDASYTLDQKQRLKSKTVTSLLTEVKRIRAKLNESKDQGSDSPGTRRKKRRIAVRTIEIHKRTAISFSCLIFAILSLTLGISNKYGGKMAGFSVSIAIFLCYYLVMTAGIQFAMKGKLAAWLGVWAANILMCIASVLFFVLSSRVNWTHTNLFDLKSRIKRTSFQAKSKKLATEKKWPSFSFFKILDLYILKKYLSYFCLIFIGLFLMVLTVSFFERIDHIFGHDKSIWMLFKYISHKIPEYSNQTLPVTVLTATLLCLGLLTKSNEITAMKTAGVSIYRIIFPIFVFGCLFSFISYFLQERIIPYTNTEAENVWNEINDLPRISTTNSPGWRMRSDGGRIFSYKVFEPFNLVFSHLTFYDINKNSWTLQRRISAERAALKGNSFHLTGVWIREFDTHRFLDFRKESELVLTEAEPKEYFVRVAKRTDHMSHSELSRHIQLLRSEGINTQRYRVDLNFKISFPIACLVMVLIGAPFAFSMGKKGALFGFGISILISLLLWGSLGIFKNLGYTGLLSPFWASFGPVLIFGLIGLFMTLKLKT